MTRALLLWTERPVRLKREQDTFDWMQLHRVELEHLGVEVRYDNSPGDWRHYSKAFRQAWRDAANRNLHFVNLESDIVPTLRAFDQVLSCSEYVCTVPYTVYGYNDNRPIGGSAVVETRVPGGWESHMARPEDVRATGCDLGLVRFSSGLIRYVRADEIPELQFDNGLLHESVNALLRRKLGRPDPIHLHWPAIENRHVYWDEGDQAHHPPGFVPVAGMMRPPTGF